jgi:hypothetical protein
MLQLGLQQGCVDCCCCCCCCCCCENSYTAPCSSVEELGEPSTLETDPDMLFEFKLSSGVGGQWGEVCGGMHGPQSWGVITRSS